MKMSERIRKLNLASQDLFYKLLLVRRLKKVLECSPMENLQAQSFHVHRPEAVAVGAYSAWMSATILSFHRVMNLYHTWRRPETHDG